MRVDALEKSVQRLQASENTVLYQNIASYMSDHGLSLSAKQQEKVEWLCINKCVAENTMMRKYSNKAGQTNYGFPASVIASCIDTLRKIEMQMSS